jgi:hypothetical protein
MSTTFSATMTAAELGAGAPVAPSSQGVVAMWWLQMVTASPGHQIHGPPFLNVLTDTRLSVLLGLIYVTMLVKSTRMSMTSSAAVLVAELGAGDRRALCNPDVLRMCLWLMAATLLVQAILGLGGRGARRDTLLWAWHVWICVMKLLRDHKTSMTFSVISMVAAHGVGALRAQSRHGAWRPNLSW